MARVGEMVVFRPHRDHDHLDAHIELAAVVGRVHPDGSADLAVFVPNRELAWFDSVAPADGGVPGSYTFWTLGRRAAAEDAPARNGETQAALFTSPEADHREIIADETGSTAAHEGESGSPERHDPEQRENP